MVKKKERIKWIDEGTISFRLYITEIMGTRGRQLLYCSKSGAAQLPERYRRSQANNTLIIYLLIK